MLGSATASTRKRSCSSGQGHRTTCWDCPKGTQHRLRLGPASLQQALTVLPFCALPQAYANSLVDHHLVLDLLPGLAGAYFARRLPVSLTYGQVRGPLPQQGHHTRLACQRKSLFDPCLPTAQGRTVQGHACSKPRGILLMLTTQAWGCFAGGAAGGRGAAAAGAVGAVGPPGAALPAAAGPLQQGPPARRPLSTLC